MSAVSGGGSCEVARSVICLKVSQFALRKFHRFTGLHAIGAVRHGEEISDGRCCDRGNLSSTRRVGMPVSQNGRMQGQGWCLNSSVVNESWLAPLGHTGERGHLLMPNQ